MNVAAAARRLPGPGRLLAVGSTVVLLGASASVLHHVTDVAGDPDALLLVVAGAVVASTLLSRLVRPAIAFVLTVVLVAVGGAWYFLSLPEGIALVTSTGVLVRDATESEILDALGEENRIVVSPIGGQGFVFGRGNQQLSPDVIRQSTIEVVASRRKLEETGVLRVDTGDADLDEELRGWLRVRVGTYERRLVKVV